MREEDPGLLLLSAGDFFAPKGILELYRSRFLADMMMLARYDAAGVGENELSYDLKPIIEEKEAGFPLVCANAYHDGTRLFEPYVIKAQRLPETRTHQDQLGIDIGIGDTKNFHAKLVELTVSALLRALVPEHRAHVPESPDLVVQDAVFDAGAHATRGTFRAQREHIAIPVLEGIHFLFNDVGHFAD